MASNWDIDEVLDQVVDAIQAGSALPFTAAELSEYRDRYRPDFKKQHDQNADWDKDGPRVLVLATLVGVLATTLASSKALSSVGRLPTYVDLESALLAGYLVSRMKFCPVPAATDGKYCGNFPPPTDVDPGTSQTIADHLYETLKLLGLFQGRLVSQS
ncbi:MAG TPA: hypothetical protein VLX28_10160 [Thermoanaerobaculia bacterium]|nr:hypothetical protein [Thermoanaerobaculia bacterium]